MKFGKDKAEESALDEIIGKCEKSMVSPPAKEEPEEESEEDSAEGNEEAPEGSKKDSDEDSDLSPEDLEKLLKIYNEMED